MRRKLFENEKEVDYFHEFHPVHPKIFHGTPHNLLRLPYCCKLKIWGENYLKMSQRLKVVDYVGFMFLCWIPYIHEYLNENNISVRILKLKSLPYNMLIVR